MITIQKATPADAALLSDIATRSFFESHGHSGPAPDIEAFASQNYSLKPIGEELNDGGNIFHIIYYNGRAAGYSKIIFNKQ